MKPSRANAAAAAVHRLARPWRHAAAGMRQRALASAPVSRVARGSVVAFFVYSTGIGLAYCAQLAIARILGVETYGIYAFVLAWMTVLAYFCALGFEVSLLRFVPAYEAKRDWARLRGVIQYAQRRSAIVGVSVVLVGTCIVMTWVSSPALRNTFLVGFLLVPVLALLWIRCSAVRTFGGVVSALAPDRIAREGTLLALVAIAALGLGWFVDAPFVMLATLVGSVVGLGWAGLAMRRLRPPAIAAVSPVYDVPTWRQAALPLIIMGAGEALMNRTGIILLGWIADTKDAGIYSLAYNVACVVTLPRVAVNTLFAPTISGLFVRKEQATLQALVTSAASWSFCAGAFIAVTLFVLAEPLLAWFGPGYDAGVPAMRILLVGQLIVAGAGSQLYVMTMTGNERSAAALLVACAAANAVLSAVLISLLGLTGAAIATTAVLIAWNAAMALFIWRRLQLLPGVLPMLRLSLRGNKNIAVATSVCQGHAAGSPRRVPQK
jgi:O-antigen/teichoic acid export membrane protein